MSTGKLVRVALAALGGLLLLVIAMLAFIVLTFDANAHKPMLVEAVHKATQRTLAIPGPVSLALFPSLGVKVGEVTLSERGSAERFASLDSAHVSLALWPLLKREVVVDRLAVRGLKARLVRFKDGKLNIDDLLGAGGPAAGTPAAAATPPPSADMPRLDIAGIALTDTEITFDDRHTPRRLQLSKLSLTGRFAPAVPTRLSLKGHLEADSPRLAADLALQARLQMGPAPGHLAVDGLDLNLDTKLGTSALKLQLGGTVNAELQAKKLDARLAGRLDDSAFKVAFAMPRFTPAAYTFDAQFDRLDLDRLRGGGATGGTPAGAAEPAGPIDFSALRTLDASGQLRIGALKVMNLKASQVHATLRAAGGQVTLAPLAAELYQGKLAGSAALAANLVPARLTLKQELSGVALGPLLEDLAGSDRLQGRGRVALDVVTAGATVQAMTRSLAGSARVELKDGAVRGINVAQAIRRAKAAVAAARGKPESSGGGTGTAAKGEATDFSDLSASFRIAGGVAHNDDLAARTPLLRLGGSGDIDLGASRLDYTVRASVVDTLQGQGGAELRDLRGRTVPVKLSGPLNAINWRIDFGAMLEEAARAELDKKREQIKEDAKRRLGDKLRGLLKK